MGSDGGADGDIGVGSACEEAAGVGAEGVEGLLDRGASEVCGEDGGSELAFSLEEGGGSIAQADAAETEHGFEERLVDAAEERLEGLAGQFRVIRAEERALISLAALEGERLARAALDFRGEAHVLVGVQEVVARLRGDAVEEVRDAAQERAFARLVGSMDHMEVRGAGTEIELEASEGAP